MRQASTDESAIDKLYQGVLRRDPLILARTASLIEQQTDAGETLVSRLLAHAGRARVLGVTGPPGAGKSTLINALVRHLRIRNYTVAVIAVDPSSSLSGGALLGDRIRMAEHHSDPNVFVRSMATRGNSGGLATATFETMILLDAAGFDFVLVETVGIGQTQTQVASLAGLVLLVLAPEMGDDVQALKAGMMEIADIFVINKADLPGAERLEHEIRYVQNLSASNKVPTPIYRVSASLGEGLEALTVTILSLCQGQSENTTRSEVWVRALPLLVQDELTARLTPSLLTRHAAQIARLEETPRQAARAVLSELIQQQKESA